MCPVEPNTAVARAALLLLLTGPDGLYLRHPVPLHLQRHALREELRVDAVARDHGVRQLLCAAGDDARQRLVGPSYSRTNEGGPACRSVQEGREGKGREDERDERKSGCLLMSKSWSASFEMMYSSLALRGAPLVLPAGVTGSAMSISTLG